MMNEIITKLGEIEMKDWISIIAVLVSPLIAVSVTVWLEKRRQKRKDCVFQQSAYRYICLFIFNWIISHLSPHYKCRNTSQILMRQRWKLLSSYNRFQ